MTTLLRLILLGALALMGLMVATCVTAPVAWWWKSSPDARVQVVDKTVPHPDYREHAALYWVLRHEKLRAADGSTDWPLSQDYLGFHPDGDEEPPHGRGDRLEPVHLEGVDLLYLADSYGVYEGDFAHDQRTALDYSRIVYGGLDRGEMDAVAAFADAGGDLVAEFNTLASPTPPGVRRRLEALLGVRWSGWSGRRFPNLADENEVPAWAPRFWREQRGTEWNFEGAGFVLVHEDTRLVVLREPLDVTAPGLTLRLAPDDALVADALEGLSFTYWFDIVSPAPTARVAATFGFEPTESGRAIFEEAGLPTTFPAVVVANEQPLRVYFAGDFADSGSGLGPWWVEGFPRFNRTLLGMWFPRGREQEPFYWGFYIPVLQTILERYPAD